MKDKLRDEALHYHSRPFPGKLAVVATKPMATQHDLALAYSPGVATPCEVIAEDAAQAANFTSRSNLVAVVTNGTAVLGLGNIGPLAAKPVMEGKAILFKKFSGIDAFDIEVSETDPDMFVETVARLEPTFGGINLEDIKAPECFEIERKLRERMDIPVFHDDQHGTAIVVGAAVTNGLRVVGKDIGRIKLVAAGGGAACLACLDLLVSMGLPRANITVIDKDGVINRHRLPELDSYKARYAQDTDATNLAEIMPEADVFLGLSAGGVLKPEMVKNMAPNPLILALANPVPEIFPDEAKAVRPDAILATGRSDYPNQVNNVLCFPFLFRGALDVVATDINEDMKKACVKAIADLACSEPSEEARNAYGGESMIFGADYLIPKPFDSRLITEIAPAVARAAMESGAATRPIEDLNAYKTSLNRFVFRSGTLMKPVFESARSQPKRVVYSDGEDQRVLQAVQQATDEGIVVPILIGRPDVIEDRIRKLGLRIKADREFDIINPESDARYKEYWETYHSLLGRRGVSLEQARTVVRTSNTVIACLSVKLGYAEAMLCGAIGRYHDHLRHVLSIIGRAPGVHRCAAMSGIMLPNGTFFICDTHVMPEPSAEEIAQMAILCAAEVRRFGVTPKVALLSYSNFGTSDLPSPRKMRRAREILDRTAPDLEVDGEMHADSALSEAIRKKLFLGSKLKGQANLLVMPNLDAANITFETLKMLGNGVPLGPILVGTALPAHLMNPSVTVRGVLNLTALAVAHAQSHAADALTISPAV